MSEKILYFCSYLTSKIINAFGSRRNDFKRILIIKLDEIGDMVTALHVFKYLHHKYPDAKLELQCKSYNKILFQYTDYVMLIDNPSAKYDLIVDLRGNYESLIYAWTHLPKYRADRGTIRMQNKFKGGQMNELTTNYQIIEPLVAGLNERFDNSIQYSEKERNTVSKYLADASIQKFAVLHIGARDATRRWPIERFQEVIRYLNSLDYSCILVGGAEDSALNNSCLASCSERNRNVAGVFNLLEFAALCDRASLFIGNESGPLHVAAAQNTALIALFGPGVKDVFYPQSEKSIIHHYFLANGHKNQDLSNTTILRISVEEVLKSVNTLLDNEAN